MNGSQGTRAEAGTSVGATPTVWVRDSEALGQEVAMEREMDISGEGWKAGETDFLSTTIEPTHPDRLSDTLHNLPAESLGRPGASPRPSGSCPSDRPPCRCCGIQESMEVKRAPAQSTFCLCHQPLNLAGLP